MGLADLSGLAYPWDTLAPFAARGSVQYGLTPYCTLHLLRLRSGRLSA